MKKATFPLEIHSVTNQLTAVGISNISQATIRQMRGLVNTLEKETDEAFIRMELGNPGLPAIQIAVDSQIEALKAGVASIYPDIAGIPEVKQEIARFVKQFLAIPCSPEQCLPTVGSCMASMICFLTINRINAQRSQTLFIDPGFPVQKQQCRSLGQSYLNFDVYNYRGTKLRDKLKSYLETGTVSSILYSNPNNPCWINFTEEELAIIGELATAYDAIVIEDLAYFGMDFRHDYSHPGKPPFQPTVARYTNQYCLLISSSKIFSYAGERIGMLVVSDAVWNKDTNDLKHFYPMQPLGNAIIYGAIHTLTSGVSYSAQAALTGVLKAVNDGSVNFVDCVRSYGDKAIAMKKAFLTNGFSIVYDKDLDHDIADGFYFTVSYKDMPGATLLVELLRYGISTISLSTTGSEKSNGLRVCTAPVTIDQFPLLEQRLQQFHVDHP